MWGQILPGLRFNIFATILFGVVYPLAITGICQLVFPHRANGSLVTVGGTAIGSELIGQSFSKPEYFQPRPSAAGSNGYDATSSGGSNYGPTNQKLIEINGLRRRHGERLTALIQERVQGSDEGAAGEERKQPDNQPGGPRGQLTPYFPGDDAYCGHLLPSIDGCALNARATWPRTEIHP